MHCWKCCSKPYSINHCRDDLECSSFYYLLCTLTHWHHNNESKINNNYPLWLGEKGWVSLMRSSLEYWAIYLIGNISFFSSGGKEVLIKVVAHAVPAYAMNVFKLPMRLYEDFQKPVARLWWDSNEDNHKIH